MEDRRKMTNSSRQQRRHSIYSRSQRMIRCGREPILNHFKGSSDQFHELKVELECQSTKDANSRQEEPKLVESGTDDHGYFSLATADNSPCPGSTETELQVDSLLKSHCLAPVTPRQQFSCCDDAAACPAKNGQLLVKPADVKIETLDDLEEVLDIGDPIFESSTCHGLHITLDATTEEDFEAKSEEEVSSPAPCQPQTSKDLAANGKHHRHVPCNEDEWERKKDQFVNLVCAHMSERPQTDVFQELNSLMSRVTDQTVGPHGDHWQHPSDFTRRNYFARFGKRERKTLHQWQEVNNRAHKRFSAIPKIFPRSQPS